MNRVVAIKTRILEIDLTYMGHMHYARSSVKQSVGKNNCEN
jgi:hypothetical protein